MKKLKLLSCLILIFFVSTMLFTGCGEQPIEKVRLNEVVHSIFYAPQYVALEKGFFEEEGLEVELTTGLGADKSMTALISDNADIGLMGPEAAVYVYNEGNENYAVCFAQLTQNAGNFLVGREQEEDFTWDNVLGKTIIGGRPGGMPQMVLEYILTQNGIIPFEDVDIITNIQFSATVGSFVGGIGDYTAEFEPAASTLEVNDSGHVVASLGTATGKVPYTSFMATKEYIINNPETVQKFTNAIYKAQQWVAEHSAEEIAEAIYPQFSETDMALLTKIVNRYKAQDTWRADPINDEEGYELLQDILDNAGELKERVPFNEIVTNEFAETVIE